MQSWVRVHLALHLPALYHPACTRLQAIYTNHPATCFQHQATPLQRAMEKKQAPIPITNSHKSLLRSHWAPKDHLTCGLMVFRL